MSYFAIANELYSHYNHTLRHLDMDNDCKYSPNDKMSYLISDNFQILMVMSRFNITLGFGDKSVRDVCQSQGIDCPTFLAVANFISSEQSGFSTDGEPQFSLTALMDYLKNAHTYFLDFSLPMIRRRLIEAIDCTTRNNVAFLILKFFDEMVTEVRKHMEYENEMVFTYVGELLDGKRHPTTSIRQFVHGHSRVNEKLNELKNIIIKYYPENGNNNLLNAVLYDIFNCEQDLTSHRQVEDCMFVPAVAVMERRLHNEC